MANAWLALAAALPLLAAPLLLTIRRAGRRRVPLFGRGEVKPPWSAHLLTLPGFILLFGGARGLGGPHGGWLYVAGAWAVSLVLTTGLLLWHNRRAAADPDGESGAQAEKPAVRG
jgi:hypothetical protein